MKTMQESFAELAVVIEEFKKAIRESKLFAAIARLDSWMESVARHLDRRDDNGAGRES